MGQAGAGEGLRDPGIGQPEVSGAMGNGQHAAALEEEADILSVLAIVVVDDNKAAFWIGSPRSGPHIEDEMIGISSVIVRS